MSGIGQIVLSLLGAFALKPLEIGAKRGRMAHTQKCRTPGTFHHAA
jgi:hypothetical protein